MKDKYINDILAKQAYIEQNMPKKDPFDKGIMRAVTSAKKSLAMDAEQEDAALRNSILTFGEEMHKMPKTRGLMSNFAQVGRALAPAIKTHDAYESKAKEENMKMLQYAQALRAAEEAKIDKLEYQAYLREHADKVLAEQKNYHQLLASAKKSGADNFANNGEFNQIKGKQEYNRIGKKYEVAADLYDEIKGIKGEYNQMLKTLEDAGLPANPITLNTMVRRGSSLISSFGDQNSIHRKLAVEYAKLNSRIERLAMQYEQADKGRGLTDFTVKYANNKSLFPKMDENPDIFLGKLNHLYHDSERSYKALDASLQDGIYINKDNYDRYLNYKNSLNPQMGATPLKPLKPVQEAEHNTSIDDEDNFGFRSKQ